MSGSRFHLIDRLRRALAGLFGAWLAAALLLSASPAGAEVTVSFYSHSWGVSGGDLYFPHAFIVLKGDLEADATPIDQSFGFTAVTVSPALLFSKVRGEVIDSSRTYVPISRKHFTVVISDGQYRSLLTAIADWEAVKGDPYELKKRNCITFVGELARVLGLDVGDDHVMDPAAFLDDLARRNPDRIQLEPDGAVAAPKTPAPVARGSASGAGLY
jgi:hypothetical protein